MNIKLFLISLSLLLGCSQNNNQNASGHLLIIGGGKRPQEVMQKFVDLAGGQNAKIAIIPTASSYWKEAGGKYVQTFLDLGAAKAKAFNILSQDIARDDSVVNQLAEYNGFFFGGGNQNKLVKYLLNSPALKLIKDRYSNGAVVGGTSAGAAVMSEIMITGDGNWEIMKRDSVVTTPGFGFINNSVIDQHFFVRRRFNRLLAVCVQNQIAGIGIDESTAIWVKPAGEMEVLGESIVLTIDINKTNVADENQKLLTARDINLNIYKSGDVFRF